MDVRCDRCQTEYELDDAIVTEAGAAVQCTTCGHTFFVRPGGATATGPALSRADEFSVPETPEWTLRTEDEKVHRFRDFNTLQRWIVERKVTRADRVSRSSGTWQALGDIADLAPFFAVVEEADRARIAASNPVPPAARDSPARSEPVPSVAALPMPGVTAPSLAGVSVAGVGAASRSSRLPEDGPTEPNRRLPPVPAAALGVRTTARLETSVRAREREARAAASAPPAGDPAEMDYLPATHRGRNGMVLVLVLGATGVGGYWLWSHRYPAVSTAPQAEVSRPATEPAATAPPAVAVAPPARPSPLPAEPVPTSPSADAVVPVVPDAGGLAIAPALEGAAPGRATAAPEDEADGRGKVRQERSGAARGAETPKPAAAQSAAGTYERWVAEGDRALARRGVAKAEKFYAQALALRPDGVAALTGSAYVLLDRQRHFKAIETFRRAIAIEPNYGPALFGIAESYRARGDAPQALLAYRQYLAMSPSGTEAPAARRQIKDLSSDDDAP
jgi:predicted Zn finger-like uncharacterized protein